MKAYFSLHRHRCHGEGRERERERAHWRTQNEQSAAQIQRKKCH